MYLVAMAVKTVFEYCDIVFGWSLHHSQAFLSVATLNITFLIWMLCLVYKILVILYCDTSKEWFNSLESQEDDVFNRPFFFTVPVGDIARSRGR